MDKRKVYLDNAATTPVDKAAFEAMRIYFSVEFGNASSAHQFGRVAREAVEKARGQVADFLGCEPKEIIFTSCATESNNLAIKGLIKGIRNQEFEPVPSLPVIASQLRGTRVKPHIITSAIEHHCVLNVCRGLEKDGIAEITYLPVYSDGIVRIEDVEKAIKENTVLVSIMYANNEIGTIQPVKEVGELIKRKNKENFLTCASPEALARFAGALAPPKASLVHLDGRRARRASSRNKVYFHVDAVQAVNYLDCNVNNLGVDLLSISAHKFYGPKGVGALYVRKGTPVARIQDGGEQEFKLRSGTYNTPGIVGLGKAISMADYQSEEVGKIKNLRDKLIDEVFKIIPNSKLNGLREKRLPNNANFSFPGAEGEAILLALDLEGIAVSTGSACASENLNPSHVLTALGLGPEETHSSVRFTLGKYTTEEDIDYVLEVLPRVVERLRKISGSGQNKGEAKKKLPDDFGC